MLFQDLTPLSLSAWFSLLILLFITACSNKDDAMTVEKDDTMTVIIENSTYTKAQIREHIYAALSVNKGRKFFNLWLIQKQPYYCVVDTSFPNLLPLFNQYLAEMSALIPINVHPCYYPTDKKPSEHKYSLFFLFWEDFSKINKLIDKSLLAEEKVSDKNISVLNQGLGDYSTASYYRIMRNEYLGTMLQMHQIVDSYPASKTKHILYSQMYKALADVSESNVIIESILHEKSTRISLSSIDRLLLESSYEIAEMKLTLEEAADELTKRVFSTLQKEQ